MSDRSALAHAPTKRLAPLAVILVAVASFTAVIYRDWLFLAIVLACGVVLVGVRVALHYSVDKNHE
jgi:hypothetical protein